MLNTLKTILGLEGVKTPKQAELKKFVLKYKTLVIGELHIQNGVWTFAYSEAFKTQTEISPLVDFPVKEKVYESAHLWPLFLSRIPGLKQPQVQDLILQEKIDPENEAALLERFGGKTIANPFTLAVQ